MPERCVILFDGYCNFCSRTVQFVYERDKRGVFLFAPLQSEIGKTLLPDAAPSGVVLLIGERAFYKSDATLQIIRRLRFPWWILFGFTVVPRPIRDAVYGWIAKNRFRIYGRREACMIPNGPLKDRFLN